MDVWLVGEDLGGGGRNVTDGRKGSYDGVIVSVMVGVVMMVAKVVWWRQLVEWWL